MWGERNLRGPFGVPKRMQEIVRQDREEEKEPRPCDYNFKAGWWCSRGLNHGGPCALRPKKSCTADVPSGWECGLEAGHTRKHMLRTPGVSTVWSEDIEWSRHDSQTYTQEQVDDLIRTVKVGTLLAAAAELVFIDKPKNMIVRQQDAAAWLMDRAQEELER